METDEFWTIIETARAATEKPFEEALTDVLAELPLGRILDFDERFEAVHASVHRWDVWAASFLISGWCSDDGFIDFRAGLISLGREWFERVAGAPDSLADHPLVGGSGCGSGSVDELEEALLQEDATYAALWAYDRVTGVKDSYHDAQEARAASRPKCEDAEPDMGEKWDFEDDDEMRRRLPRLAALCLDEDDED
ncbi:DUF4240 domain-containing protein [Kitasatospora nipponensis]|uniref:DUF4240 domain-containing protein n=1 Tax=Kitasatospora nipponensis TaxID=258049 RepID=A0ABP4G6W5_9ACTN